VDSSCCQAYDLAETTFEKTKEVLEPVAEKVADTVEAGYEKVWNFRIRIMVI